MRVWLFCLFSFVFLWSEDVPTLKIYNYSDYVDTNILINFAKENKIKIRYEMYENNEQLFKKIKNEKEGFDLACPSTNFISKFQEENYLLDIDKSKLKNYKYINKILLAKNNNGQKQSFIPYFGGTIGIIYDTTQVKPITSWNDLWRADLKESVLIGSDYRDMFGVVLKSLGYSVNTKNDEEIKKAYEKLLQLIPNIKEMSSEDIPKYFLKDKFVVGIVFNGDARLLKEAESKFAYVYSNEGTIQWMDGFVMLKNGKNND